MKATNGDAGASREAKRLAAVLLDVLAGARTPPQAAETLGVDLGELRQLSKHAERLIDQERAKYVPRGNLLLSVIDGGDQPGLPDEIEQPIAERGRFGISAFQAVEPGRELRGHARRVDIMRGKNSRQVGTRQFDKLLQPMLDLHGIVRAMHAHADGVFQRLLTGPVQSGHQTFDLQ